MQGFAKKALLLQLVSCGVNLGVVVCMWVYPLVYQTNAGDVCLLVSMLLLLAGWGNPMGITGVMIGVTGCVRAHRRGEALPAGRLMVLFAALSLLVLACWFWAVSAFVNTTGGA